MCSTNSPYVKERKLVIELQKFSAVIFKLHSSRSFLLLGRDFIVITREGSFEVEDIIPPPPLYFLYLVSCSNFPYSSKYLPKCSFASNTSSPSHNPSIETLLPTSCGCVSSPFLSFLTLVFLEVYYAPFVKMSFST